MNIKQWKADGYLKTKYSQIAGFEKEAKHEARHAMMVLQKNGYAVMPGHRINEALNLIRAMRELRQEYTMKVIYPQYGQDNFYFEFTTAFFEDDRLDNKPAFETISGNVRISNNGDTTFSGDITINSRKS